MQAGEASYVRLPDGSIVVGWYAGGEHCQISVERDGSVRSMDAPTSS